jgi:hypothetical protein
LGQIDLIADVIGILELLEERIALREFGGVPTNIKGRDDFEQSWGVSFPQRGAMIRAMTASAGPAATPAGMSATVDSILKDFLSFKDDIP